MLCLASLSDRLLSLLGSSIVPSYVRMLWPLGQVTPLGVGGGDFLTLGFIVLASGPRPPRVHHALAAQCLHTLDPNQHCPY